MGRPRLLRIGLAGTAVTAVCCFTPILVWSLAGLGLGAFVGWIDLILLPALAGFVALTLYALWRRRRNAP